MPTDLNMTAWPRRLVAEMIDLGLYPVRYCEEQRITFTRGEFIPF